MIVFEFFPPLHVFYLSVCYILFFSVICVSILSGILFPNNILSYALYFNCLNLIHLIDIISSIIILLLLFLLAVLQPLVGLGLFDYCLAFKIRFQFFFTTLIKSVITSSIDFIFRLSTFIFRKILISKDSFALRFTFHYHKSALGARYILDFHYINLWKWVFFLFTYTSRQSVWFCAIISSLQQKEIQFRTLS